MARLDNVDVADANANVQPAPGFFDNAGKIIGDAISSISDSVGGIDGLLNNRPAPPPPDTGPSTTTILAVGMLGLVAFLVYKRSR